MPAEDKSAETATAPILHQTPAQPHNEPTTHSSNDDEPGTLQPHSQPHNQPLHQDDEPGALQPRLSSCQTLHRKSRLGSDKDKQPDKQWVADVHLPAEGGVQKRTAPAAPIKAVQQVLSKVLNVRQQLRKWKVPVKGVTKKSAVSDMIDKVSRLHVPGHALCTYALSCASRHLCCQEERMIDKVSKPHVPDRGYRRPSQQFCLCTGPSHVCSLSRTSEYSLACAYAACVRHVCVCVRAQVVDIPAFIFGVNTPDLYYRYVYKSVLYACGAWERCSLSAHEGSMQPLGAMGWCSRVCMCVCVCVCVCVYEHVHRGKIIGPDYEHSDAVVIRTYDDRRK